MKKPDKYQRKVIKDKAQSILVLAGAGSGKTFTIISKIKQLIEENINKEEILCISFTKSSSEELKNKLKKENIIVKVKTFHSLGYEIISKYKNIELDDNRILKNITQKYIKKNHHLNKIMNLKFIRLGGKDKIFDKLENNIILNTTYKDRLVNTIITFINLFKSNNYQIIDFNLFYKKNKTTNMLDKKMRHKLFLNLTKTILKEYQKKLKESKKIDYNDMINLAIKIVKEREIFHYKYIIIDEYQDTSKNKNELIRQIQIKTKCKLLVVGDDWQSIYSFSGSNLESFLKFKSIFPNAKVIKLKKTYRNSKELLYIGKKFICKNPNQIKKNLKSKKKEKYPIYICYYNNNIKEAFDKIKIKEALVLGRNNKDKKLVPKNLPFLTIHKSKGLETKRTIIINLEDNYDSLPSKIIDSEYLVYVKSKTDNYKYSEERRLFYVAITRTKTVNYLIVNKNNPSIFVKELIKDYSKYIKIIE